MALTKVGPAGIGSTPGTGYTIGDSFLHSTGLNATNAYYTGIVTSQSIRVLGDLQVDGTTTTLDTEVTSVDKLEVAANNTTVGVAITQSGTGDIFNLYDGSSEVFTVTDGGKVGVGQASPTKKLEVAGGAVSLSPDTAGKHTHEFTTNAANDGRYFIRSNTTTKVDIQANGVSYFNGGDIGIGINSPIAKLHLVEATEGESVIQLNSGDSYPTVNRGLKIKSATGPTGYAGSKWIFDAVSSGGQIQFQTVSTQRLTIRETGKIGINTDNPISDLHVITPGQNEDGTFRVGGSAAALGLLIDYDQNGNTISKITSNPTYTNSNSLLKICVDGDLNADQLVLKGDGNVGVGEDSPTARLDVRRGDADGKIAEFHQSTGYGIDIGSSQADAYIASGYNQSFIFKTDPSSGQVERLRITSAGVMVVGHNAATTSGASNNSNFNIVGNIGSATGEGQLNLWKRTAPAADNVLGQINFCGDTTGDPGGYIKAEADAAWDQGGDTSDHPSRLTFWTCPDNSSVPAERLRVTSGGDLFVAGTGGMNTTQLPNGNTININGNSSNDGFSVIRYNAGYGAYGLNIGRSKSGTVGTNTIVSDGNDLGHITFYGADGSSFLKASMITSQVDGTPSAGSAMPGRLVFKTTPDGGATPAERLRITSGGKVLINSTTNGSSADLQVGATGASIALGGDASANGTGRFKFLCSNSTHNWQISTNDTTAGALEFAKSSSAGGSTYASPSMMITNTGQVKVFGEFTAKKGSSAMQFDEYSNGAVIWLDGADGDFSGGDYFNIMANNSQQLSFGYAGAEHIKINTSGQMHLNNYPMAPSVASGSHLKLRAGGGAWGISIGMRASQNDYAYIGFTDMDGTEQIGDIYMQRTGTKTGQMVFSTNNGNTGSTNRMRIGPSGRLCVSPSANFTSESSSFVMTVVNNGAGSSGGYPGINIRSVATGGNTNSAPGMTLVATDSAWSLQQDGGNVHGLGILTGNTASSTNAAMYIRSDKKVSLGPQCFNSSGSSTYAHSALHVTGGSLSIGPLNNDSSNQGREGGRYVHGWYMTTYSSGGGSYIHIKTNLWAGGSPHGNYQYIMGGFHILGYRYSTSGVSRSTVYFHNWNGGYANLDIENEGSWDPGSTVYTSSDGYVVLRMANAAYYGYVIDLVQHIWYNTRNIEVTATQYSSSANAY